MRFTIPLLLLALTAAVAVADPPIQLSDGLLDLQQADGLGLETIEGTQTLLYKATEKTHKFCHHANLVVFQQRLFMIWSNGLVDEDSPGQRILMSWSTDGETWKPPLVLTGEKHDAGKKEKAPETLVQEGKSSETRKETEPGKKTRAVKQVKAPSPPKTRQVERPFVETPRKPEVAVKKVQPVKPVKQVQPLEYTVQVFSGRKRKNAEKLVKRLKDKGFTGAYIYQHLSKEGVTFYRVRIGRMEKTEINELSKRIKALDFIDSIKVTRY